MSINNWIVFQQRINISYDFTQSWNSYKSGFGIYNGSFWMGLEKVYQMTKGGTCRGRFEMLFNNSGWNSVEYDTFYLDSSTSFYKIHLGGYSGDMASDPMNGACASWGISNGMSFSTFDKCNDNAASTPCTTTYGGGWWNNACFCLNLNGMGKGFTFFNVTFHPIIVSRMLIKCQ